MKTDKIFYILFQTFPELLFQLIGESPQLADHYKFESIEIKELSFRLDGLFFPEEQYVNDPIYFVEVQFQEDPDFYWRFITEIFLYLNQYKPQRRCYAVVLWADPQLEPDFPLPYQHLLVNEHLYRIYLDQLNLENPTSLGLSIIQFIMATASEARETVPLVINQARRQLIIPDFRQKVIELIQIIIVYKFPQKTRQELEIMFNLTEWRETKYYPAPKLKSRSISIFNQFVYHPHQSVVKKHTISN